MGIDERTIGSDPIGKFHEWYREAQKSERMPDAMALATASRNGAPSVRMVLLKQADASGFVFYTNYESRKGKELLQNPFAALLFHWESLERQVRIEGAIETLSAAESDEYFRTRPRESQISAAVSPQSSVVPSREELVRLREELERSLADRPVPRPASWGGFRVKPEKMEFWQGREARLHDRILFERRPDGSWKISRLAP